MMKKEEYEVLSKDIVSISKSYQNEENILKFSSHLEKKLDNFNPTLMIYGVYNAGKSTLLNAIFGKEEMAKTGDKPETAQVSAYTYNGYTIYDTPGINAKEEHQEVTDEHIKKCELVVFVLDNESFEQEYICEKIDTITRANKPILIAMNNKNGIDMDSTEAQNEINKLNKNLNKHCKEKIEGKVSVAFVDAKTALEGKLENEEELIKESKILEFESMINKLLGSAGKEEVSNALNLYISEYITDTISIIDSKIDNPEMKKTQEMITYLEKLKQRTIIELRDISLQIVSIATANLFELMLSQDKKSIDDMVKKSFDEISQKIKDRVKFVQKELKEKSEKFNLEFQELTLKNPNIQLKNLSEEMQDYSQISSSSNNAGTALAVGTVIASTIPPTLVIPTPIPIPVKPLIMIASALFGAFSGSSESQIKAQAKLEEKRAKHLSAKNRTDEFGLNAKQQVNDYLNKNVEQVFLEVIRKFTDFSNTLENKNQKLLDDKKSLQNILDKVS